MFLGTLAHASYSLTYSYKVLSALFPSEHSDRTNKFLEKDQKATGLIPND